MNEMVKVSKEEFYAYMIMDVTPYPHGDKYPYTSIWKLRDGREVGRITRDGEHWIKGGRNESSD